MRFDCSNDLNTEFAQYIDSIREHRPYPSVVSACEFTDHRACGKSGNYHGVHYHKSITSAFESKLGCKVGDTHGFRRDGKPLTVGCCGEQHSANNLLKQMNPEEDQFIEVADFVFAKSIRIKSKQMLTQEIPPCVNCETVFTK